MLGANQGRAILGANPERSVHNLQHCDPLRNSHPDRQPDKDFLVLGMAMSLMADVEKNSPRKHIAIGRVHGSSQGGPC